MRLLYCIGGGIGNVVHATPALEALKSLGHDVTVHLTAEWPGTEKLIDHDAVLTGPLPDLDPFDRVLIAPFAFSGSNEWPKDRPIPDKMRQGMSPLPGDATPEVEFSMWFARVLGFDGLTPAPQVRHSAETPVEGDYLVIAPGVQRLLPIWLKKCYPHWGVVVKAFLDKSIQVVVVGAPADNAPEWDRCVNLCGKTNLWDLSGVLNGARAVVGVDNGPTCLAAALRRWTVVLWGPTSLTKNRKYGPRVVDLGAGLPCLPCQFRPDDFASCRHVNCMKAIEPPMVVRYVMECWEHPA